MSNCLILKPKNWDFEMRYCCFDDTTWSGEYGKLSDFLAANGLVPESTPEP